MTKSGEAESGSAIAGGPDEEQRRLALARLADLDVLTDDDEEEINRFRAYAAAPVPRQRPTAWLRRRPAFPL